jgi:hypothetical protein
MRFSLRWLCPLLLIVGLSGCNAVKPTSPEVAEFVGTYKILDRRNARQDFLAYDRVSLWLSKDGRLELNFYLPNSVNPSKKNALYQCRSRVGGAQQKTWCQYDGMLIQGDFIDFTHAADPFVSNDDVLVSRMLNKNDGPLRVDHGYLLSYGHGEVMRFTLDRQ